MDLMYGTESPDMDDFSAREFRLKELLRAQNLSAGPNFVVSKTDLTLPGIVHIEHFYISITINKRLPTSIDNISICTTWLLLRL